MRQLTIIGKRRRLKVNVTATFIRMSLCHKSCDKFNNVIHMIHYTWTKACAANAKRLNIFIVSIDKAISDLRNGNTKIIGLLNQLVIHICKVGDVVHFVACVLQVSSYYIEKNRRARISDMNIIIYGWSAYIHSNLARFNRLKSLLLACERIIYCN